MTPAPRPTLAPRPSRRRGGRGQAASSAPGDPRLAGLFAELATILRLETIRLAVQHQRSEIVALGDPVTGAIPAKVAVAHLRRLRRHRQQIGAVGVPLAGGACPPAAPPPPGVRNEPAQSSRRGDSTVGRTKPRRRDTVAGVPTSADALVTSAAVAAAAHQEFDKTKPPRERAEIPFTSCAPAPEGPAREQPVNLALLGLAMLEAH
jgi:hypothetical protein